MHLTTPHHQVTGGYKLSSVPPLCLSQPQPLARGGVWRRAVCGGALSVRRRPKRAVSAARAACAVARPPHAAKRSLRGR